MGELRQLTYDECVRRLDVGGVGRVAITEHAMPAILPVNFVRSGPSIVFRTEPGGTLARGCNGTVVAFEIDGIDRQGTCGWSVLVVGAAKLLTDGAVVEVSLGRVSGREVVNGANSGLWSRMERDVAL